jgi:hypothetical protein
MDARGYFKGMTVQKVCRLARDEDEVRRTLDVARVPLADVIAREYIDKK